MLFLRARWRVGFGKIGLARARETYDSQMCVCRNDAVRKEGKELVYCIPADLSCA